MNSADTKDIAHIIEDHKKIFGKSKDLKLGSYLDIKDNIFSLYRLFCLLDDSYDNKLNRNFLYETLAIITQLKKSLEGEDTQLQKTLTSITDTRLYYFDQLICHRANNSVETKNYLRTKHIYKLLNTQHFMDVTKKKFQHTIHSEHSKNLSSNQKQTITYKKSIIDYILSIPEINKKATNFDPVLNKLIHSKSKIALFKDMIDDDIRNLITVFKFTIFKPGETIIQEGDTSTDIFFIIEGQCRATVNKSSVGILKKNQIFGEFAFLLGKPRSATIKAITETTLVKFKFDEQLFRKYPFSFSMLYKNITEQLIIKIANINKKHLD